MRRARSAIPFALAGAAAIGAALLGACSGGPALPSVPAPWEAAENPAAEPASYAPIPNPDQWERVGSSVRGATGAAVVVMVASLRFGCIEPRWLLNRSLRLPSRLAWILSAGGGRRWTSPS